MGVTAHPVHAAPWHPHYLGATRGGAGATQGVAHATKAVAGRFRRALGALGEPLHRGIRMIAPSAADAEGLTQVAPERRQQAPAIIVDPKALRLVWRVGGR
jgi:hypothetical protein